MLHALPRTGVRACTLFAGIEAASPVDRGRSKTPDWTGMSSPGGSCGNSARGASRCCSCNCPSPPWCATALPAWPIPTFPLSTPELAACCRPAWEFPRRPSSWLHRVMAGVVGLSMVALVHFVAKLWREKSAPAALRWLLGLLVLLALIVPADHPRGPDHLDRLQCLYDHGARTSLGALTLATTFLVNRSVLTAASIEASAQPAVDRELDVAPGLAWRTSGRMTSKPKNRSTLVPFRRQHLPTRRGTIIWS